MDKPPRIFSLESVNALIPRLSELVGRQLDRRARIERSLRDLGALTGQKPDAISIEPGDPEPIASMKRELVARIEEYQGGWGELEEMGAVLKDPRVGLVDFYGTVDGATVWLCWKYGEREVAYFHALDEGYAARKALRQSIKHRLLN
jgi:hypothetical protein